MDDRIFKVSDLNRLTREILEGTFPNIQVEGEILKLCHACFRPLVFHFKR